MTYRQFFGRLCCTFRSLESSVSLFDFVHDGEVVIARESPLAGQQLVEHEAEREHGIKTVGDKAGSSITRLTAAEKAATVW